MTMMLMMMVMLMTMKMKVHDDDDDDDGDGGGGGDGGGIDVGGAVWGQLGGRGVEGSFLCLLFFFQVRANGRARDSSSIRERASERSIESSST